MSLNFHKMTEYIKTPSTYKIRIFTFRFRHIWQCVLRILKECLYLVRKFFSFLKVSEGKLSIEITWWTIYNKSKKLAFDGKNFYSIKSWCFKAHERIRCFSSTPLMLNKAVISFLSWCQILYLCVQLCEYNYSTLIIPHPFTTQFHQIK